MSRNTHTYGKPRAGKSMRSEALAPGGSLFTLHITQKVQRDNCLYGGLAWCQAPSHLEASMTPPRTSLPFPGAPEAATAPSSITLTGEEGGHKVTSSSQGGHRGLIQSKGCEPGQCARVEGSKVSQGAQSRQGSAGAQARGPS